MFGLGRSGVAAARLLKNRGAEVELFDDQELSLEDLSARGLVGFGSPQASQDLTGLDALIISPGIPPKAKARQNAEALGIPVLGELELALREIQGRVTVVTGSHGKSTVTTWLQALHQANGKKSIACGNLGLPVSEVALAGEAWDEVVIEASSFQLHDSPRIRVDAAVFTAYAPNHLDWHPDEADYQKTKLSLLDRLVPGAPVAYLPGFPGLKDALQGKDLSLYEVSAEGPYGADEGAPGIVRTPQGSIDLKELPGGMGLAALAPSVALAAAGATVGPSIIQEASKLFKPLAHRLEDLGEVQGRRFVNDSKATTPAASAYSLERVVGKTVLILGGKDKGLSFSPFRDVLKKAHTLVFTGAARERLSQELGDLPHHVEADFDAALIRSFQACPEGGAILLAPGCSSFDCFANFEARGDHFRNWVNTLRSSGGPA